MTSPLDTAQALKARINALRQATRMLQLSFPKNDGPEGVLLVVKRLKATERLSGSFKFKVDILSDNPKLKLKQLMGKLVTIEHVREDGSKRFFSGHIFKFKFVKSDAGYSHFKMTVLPWLEFLSHDHDNYIFQNKTLQEQLTILFGHYDMSDWKVLGLGPDRPMTYASQYGETRKNYVDRRLEDIGAHYWYEHRPDGSTLMLGHDSTAAPPIDGSGQITWQGESGVRDVGITQFSAERSVAPTRYSATSFDFKAPRPEQADITSLNDQGDIPALEVYEYAGAHGFKAPGGDPGARAPKDELVRTRMEAIEAGAKHFIGIGNDDHVQAGRSFTLNGHRGLLALDPSEDPDDASFLIVEATHTITNNFETGEGEAAEYRCEFTCIRKKIPWRPKRGANSTQPKIVGVQTAICCTPQDEELWTDEFGRVHLQFHWDRVGRNNPGSSALVRVARPVSGQRFGLIGTPRKGQELIVAWLDGNPDLPLVIGSLDSPDNLPPHFDHEGSWPKNAALSGWDTQELGGSSLQQLIFNDTHGRPSTQLSSDHGAARLSLGWLGTYLREGEFQPRGEGAELRTLAAAVVRAAQGLLLLTETNGDEGKQLARAELQASLGAASELVRSLGAAANTAQANAIDPAPQNQLKTYIDQLENGSNTAPGAAGGQQPVIGIGGSAGIALATPKSTTVFTGENLDIATQGHTQQSTNKRWLVNVGESISWFAAGLADQAKQTASAIAVKLIAARGKVLVQAQSGGIDLQAERDIDLGANGKVSLNGKGGITLTEPGGAQIELANGNVTIKCQAYAVQAASFSYTSGAAGGVAKLPSMPGQAQLKPWLGLEYLDPDTGAPIDASTYEVGYTNGVKLEGALDGAAQARHPDVPDAQVKQVVYKPRTPQQDKDAELLDSLL